MARGAFFSEVQQPPATREISNVANATHPFLQSESSTVAYLVRTAANTARLRCFVLDGFGNKVSHAMVHVATSGDLDTATPAAGGGALASAAPVGTAPASLDFLAEVTTGHIEVPLVFHSAGTKDIAVDYGNYRLRVSIDVT